MSDAAVFGGLVLAFAVLVTVHLVIVCGLLVRRPRWHAPIALAVPPLAPYFALSAGMSLRGAAWLLSALAYGVLLFFGRK